ncbi:hypothetical protein CMV_022607 [Castanea mollissima]|uniref:Uncharacterized protein n=1 Tax=Castanea mollissima TaxID=60419 RepID=A0A8J4VE83_9ROSI|nr:hypothetical protein CMV_022607 [Castanea mollissima]
MEKEMKVLSNQNLEEKEADFHAIRIVEGESNWSTLMEKKRKQKPRLLRKSAGNISCCIFRVPQSLVEINKKAYQPHIVPIGPYHNGKDHLKMIQEHKWRFLDTLIARTENQGVCLDDYFKAIASKEESIREFYSEAIDLNSNEFVEMMVLDGCFIVEILCIVGKIVQNDPKDPIFNMLWVFPFLMRDLLRLENQIPFFVLQTLFDMYMTALDKEGPSLAQLALDSFDYVIERPTEVLQRYYNVKAVHLLDLFRLSFIPQSNGSNEKNYLHGGMKDSVSTTIPSAQRLHVAGIKFKPRKSDSVSLLDIKFDNGVLEIPPLAIDDSISSFFLNCVAFEQCYSDCSKHITSYTTFMSFLINKPSDVGFLSDQNVIENDFGTDKEVVRFFSNISKDVTFDFQQSYLFKLFEDVNEHCRNQWHVRWADFKYTYFNTPWSFISALAATLLLVLTMIQAFFAIYAYVLPPPPH